MLKSEKNCDPQSKESPTNFPISETTIDTGKFPPGIVQSQGLLDFYQNSIFNNNLYVAWADNTGTPAPDYWTIAMFRHGVFDPKDGKLKFSEQIQIPTFRYSPLTQIAEFTVSVNPTNPCNIAVGSNLGDSTLFTANPPALFQNLVSTSFDKGKTWVTRRWDNNIFPGIFNLGDDRILFDKFGNLWLVFLGNSTGIPFEFPANLNIAVSIDGGLTFTSVVIVIPPSQFAFGFDYPQLIFGSDGSTGFGLYITADLIDVNGVITPSVVFVPITGLGSYGTAITNTLDSLVGLVALGSPAISKNGDLYIAYVNQPPFGGAFQVLLVTIPQGIVGVSNGNILGPFLVAQTNMTSDPNTTTGTTSIQFQPGRGVGPNTETAIVFDGKHHRAYIFYADIIPAGSQNMDLFVKWTDDMGQTFHGPIKINNFDQNNRCLQSIARDPKNGDLFFTWYDCRADPSNQKAKYFGALITPEQFKELAKNAPATQSMIVKASNGIQKQISSTRLQRMNSWKEKYKGSKDV